MALYYLFNFYIVWMNFARLQIARFFIQHKIFIFFIYYFGIWTHNNSCLGLLWNMEETSKTVACRCKKASEMK